MIEYECNVCGSHSAHDELVSEVFTIEGRRVLVEHIPARICDRCGDATFANDTVERVRLMVHGEANPVRTERLEVFDYS